MNAGLSNQFDLRLERAEMSVTRKISHIADGPLCRASGPLDVCDTTQ